MKYPEKYTVLCTEEMEYLTGGGDANVAMMGIGFLGGIVCALASSIYRGTISKKLQNENPEKYQPTADGSNLLLAQDTLKTYFMSAGGIMITLGQIASVGCIAAGTLVQ